MRPSALPASAPPARALPERPADVATTTADEFIAARAAARAFSGPGRPSPALDLQRRLSDAALRDFYAPARQGRSFRLSRPAIVLAIGLGCWSAVFGVGALLIR